MASWIDLFALLLTAAAFGGTIYGVVVLIRSVSQGVESTKTKLKDRGYTISDKGMSVKTSKRYDREDYIDATQRNILKAVNAASFNKRGSESPSPAGTPTLSPPALNRTISGSSVGEEKKKNGGGFFGRKKKNPA